MSRICEMTHSTTFTKAALLAAVTATANLASAATMSWIPSWDDVQFGGFLSQGYLYSSDNNYLGKSSDGTSDFREYGLSASVSEGKWRVGGQVFGQKLGHYGDDKVLIDWAMVDYQAAQWLGLRAGRVKLPRGLYNEALDVDAVRPFVLLPQSVYDARLRDFNSAFNGALAYGNINLGRIGSIDYKAFYGDMPMSTESGASDYFNNHQPASDLKIGMDSVRGGTLFWNTPLAGLRVGYSYTFFSNLRTDRNSPVFGDYFKNTDYQRQLISAEYITGDWVFAAEAGRDFGYYAVVFGPITSHMNVASDYAYVSASRRVNDWLELGAYWSYSKDTQHAVPESISTWPDLKQNDYAVSARIDVTEHSLLKFEVHYMDGSGKVFDTLDNPQPLSGQAQSWMLYTAKFTVFF